jgi:hypothetical protein
MHLPEQGFRSKSSLVDYKEYSHQPFFYLQTAIEHIYHLIVLMCVTDIVAKIY